MSEPCPQGRTDYEACFAPFRYCPIKGCGRAEGGVQLPTDAKVAEPIYVREGWWHPNVKSGQVHDHPENPGASWSIASHRLCEPVFTQRHTTASSDGGNDA